MKNAKIIASFDVAHQLHIIFAVSLANIEIRRPLGHEVCRVVVSFEILNPWIHQEKDLHLPSPSPWSVHTPWHDLFGCLRPCFLCCGCSESYNFHYIFDLGVTILSAEFQTTSNLLRGVVKIETCKIIKNFIFVKNRNRAGNGLKTTFQNYH